MGDYWNAVFSLERWFFVMRGDLPNPVPFVGMIDNAPHLFAFTSGERAHAFGQDAGLAEQDGTVKVLALPLPNAISICGQLAGQGVPTVVYDVHQAGITLPTDQVEPLWRQLSTVDEVPAGPAPVVDPVFGWYATFQGQEFRADPMPDGTVELFPRGPGELPPMFQRDEQGTVFASVPRNQLSELYTINLTATVDGEPFGVVAADGQARLVYDGGDGFRARQMGLTEVEFGVFEAVVPRERMVMGNGLRGDLPLDREVEPPTVMQKVLTPQQVSDCLANRYRFVAGFVHRAQDVAHFRKPAEVVANLGLTYPGSPFSPDPDEVHVLRFAAIGGAMNYDIAYGGSTPEVAADMQGYLVLPRPFLGTGYTSGGTTDTTAPVWYIRGGKLLQLPARTELWALRRDGSEQFVGVYLGRRRGWQRAG